MVPRTLCRRLRNSRAVSHMPRTSSSNNAQLKAQKKCILLPNLGGGSKRSFSAALMLP